MNAIIIGRFADLLWNRYAHIGLHLWFNNALTAEQRALMLTALRTYIAFCRKHSLTTSIDWDQVYR